MRVRGCKPIRKVPLESYLGTCALVFVVYLPCRTSLSLRAYVGQVRSGQVSTQPPSEPLGVGVVGWCSGGPVTLPGTGTHLSPPPFRRLDLGLGSGKLMGVWGGGANDKWMDGNFRASRTRNCRAGRWPLDGGWWQSYDLAWAEKGGTLVVLFSEHLAHDAN